MYNVKELYFPYFLNLKVIKMYTICILNSEYVYILNACLLFSDTMIL